MNQGNGGIFCEATVSAVPMHAHGQPSYVIVADIVCRRGTGAKRSKILAPQI